MPTFSVTVSSCGAKRVEEDYPAGQLLLEFPKGPYTTMRTYGPSKVFSFTEHVKRLSKSLQGLLDRELPSLAERAAHADSTEAGESEGGESGMRTASPDALFSSAVSSQPCPLHHRLEDGCSADNLHHIVEPTIRAAILLMRDEANLTDAVPLKITTLLTTADAAFTSVRSPLEVVVHVQVLEQPEYKPVEVAVAADSRELGAIKSSSWVQERQQYMQNFHEILLLDADRGVAEGSQTNFFVIDRHGCLWTAEEGIVHGTIRQLVLEACADLDIRVELTAPRVDAIGDWQECFIASTSRIILPVSKVVFTHKSLADREPIEFPQSAFTDRLRKHIEGLIESRSETVMEA